MKESDKDDAVYLEDILACIGKIKEFTKGMDFGKFGKNLLVQDAVLRNIEVMGEAASKLPESTRKKHPEVEWRKIIGMRNKLIHGYDDVDAEIVWNVVEKDLPDFERKIRLLRENSKGTKQ